MYPLLIDQQLFENENDVILYLAQRQGLHYHTMRKLFSTDAFSGNTPYQMLINLELFEHMFNRYSKKQLALRTPQKYSSQKNLAKPRLELKLTIEGFNYVFYTKNDIYLFFSKRYKTSKINISNRTTHRCIFWTTNIIDVVQDIVRADAYHNAYMVYGSTFPTSYYVERKQKSKQGDKNMPAFDGEFHLEEQPLNLTAHEQEIEHLRIMAQHVGIKPQTIRRQYKKMKFTKAPEYYANHLNEWKADYIAYKEEVDKVRMDNMQKLHEKQRSGELPSSRSYRRKAIKGDVLMTGTNSIHLKIKGLKDTIDGNNQKMQELEEQNKQYEALIASHEEKLKVLEEAQRIIESFN